MAGLKGLTWVYGYGRPKGVNLEGMADLTDLTLSVLQV